MKMTSESVENNNVPVNTIPKENSESTIQEDLLSHLASSKLTLENDVTDHKCAKSTQVKQAESDPIKAESEPTKNEDENHQTCPRISVTEIDCPVESTPHTDKTCKVPCRQIPGSPDMSPVTRRRRTALAKKAMELQKDGKITRIRVLSANSVVLEFRDKSDDEDELCHHDFLSPGRRGSRDDSSLLWKRYKSPRRGERSRTVPSIKLGEFGSK